MRSTSWLFSIHPAQCLPSSQPRRNCNIKRNWCSHNAVFSCQACFSLTSICWRLTEIWHASLNHRHNVKEMTCNNRCGGLHVDVSSAKVASCWYLGEVSLRTCGVEMKWSNWHPWQKGMVCGARNFFLLLRTRHLFVHKDCHICWHADTILIAWFTLAPQVERGSIWLAGVGLTLRKSRERHAGGVVAVRSGRERPSRNTLTQGWASRPLFFYDLFSHANLDPLEHLHAR